MLLLLLTNTLCAKPPIPDITKFYFTNGPPSQKLFYYGEERFKNYFIIPKRYPALALSSKNSKKTGFKIEVEPITPTSIDPMIVKLRMLPDTSVLIYFPRTKSYLTNSGSFVIGTKDLKSFKCETFVQEPQNELLVYKLRKDRKCLYYTENEGLKLVDCMNTLDQFFYLVPEIAIQSFYEHEASLANAKEFGAVLPKENHMGIDGPGQVSSTHNSNKRSENAYMSSTFNVPKIRPELEQVVERMNVKNALDERLKYEKNYNENNKIKGANVSGGNQIGGKNKVLNTDRQKGLTGTFFHKASIF